MKVIFCTRSTQTIPSFRGGEARRELDQLVRGWAPAFWSMMLANPPLRIVEETFEGLGERFDDSLHSRNFGSQSARKCNRVSYRVWPAVAIERTGEALDADRIAGEARDQDGTVWRWTAEARPQG